MTRESNIEVITAASFTFFKKCVLQLIFLFYLFLSGSSCKKILDVEPPKTIITRDQVFEDDGSVSSAVLGLYIQLYSYGQSFASGDEFSVASLAGMSADELHNYPEIDFQLVSFEQNSLRADNPHILRLWTSMYKVIYQANALIEGLAKSNSISPALSKQAKGEALFVRAFCNFYLVNCFGDIPLVLTTEYKKNKIISRTSTGIVYDQIEADLLEAENLLQESYKNSNRGWINKFAATAFLSRIYLYKMDWERAEDKSTNVISQSALYTLLTNPNFVFLANSNEAIWQLIPLGNASSTNEADLFEVTKALNFYTLDVAMASLFEPGDKRRSIWVDSISPAVYLPYKYKKSFGNQSLPNEHSMVFRLAEQYLIRAEARARQNKLSQAIGDIDMIRNRAGLPLIQNINPSIGLDELMLALEKERRVELFTEWGHRWFDLKRWGHATDVLSLVKVDWSVNDQLYPIPEDELKKNPNIAPQNAGY